MGTILQVSFAQNPENVVATNVAAPSSHKISNKCNSIANMCFNVKTQYLRRFFSLRFVSACVCSDLDLCHVSELVSRQMGLILCCADRCYRNHLWNQQFDWSLFSQFYTRGFPGDPSKDVKHLRLSW